MVSRRGRGGVKGYIKFSNDERNRIQVTRKKVRQEIMDQREKEDVWRWEEGGEMEHTTKHRSSHFNSNQTSKQPASLIKGGREVEERERERGREKES